MQNGDGGDEREGREGKHLEEGEGWRPLEKKEMRGRKRRMLTVVPFPGTSEGGRRNWKQWRSLIFHRRAPTLFSS